MWIGEINTEIVCTCCYIFISSCVVLTDLSYKLYYSSTLHAMLRSLDIFDVSERLFNFYSNVDGDSTLWCEVHISGVSLHLSCSWWCIILRVVEGKIMFNMFVHQHSYQLTDFLMYLIVPAPF
jgi:hypothetical protein